MNRYLRPGKADGVFNAVVGVLTKLGLSVAGSRVLLVRGRKSGQIRSTPVNLLKVGGQRYLVAPRGQTQWVRNLRAAGEGQLRVGRRVETFRFAELTEAEKVPILRAYLKRWAWEVSRFFDGVDHQSPDEVLRDVAPGFPVFRITGTA
ncbi:nitroreductase family deazaflavin-dependent oxidoreductase [Amycolatopsis granulosa]|uniref:nitroreductase family deazaflavin-dependent oxidoreductase n=1 Tax=Amycolatopsis granulosa TaxID=185684 RepID=UPI00141F8694|nr:nitroreductase family deazaflavin-dependent oxidoreductase [Amycolatopsis granulosa]NIH85939.1 deazaflavin-dependent oxidoreductase (nitroreductase family) [Amycolatopsis granulosa]